MRTLIICLLLAISSSGSASSDSTHNTAKEAYQHYTNGLHATSAKERNGELNRALTLYTTLEPSEGGFTAEQGRLYYDIGNTYFQLEEYPLAILYYYKAYSLIPRDPLVRKNLSIAQGALGLPISHPMSFLSSRELWLLWIGAGFCLFLCFSLVIWYQTEAYKKASYFAWGIWLFLLCYLAFRTYFSPVEAVVVQTSLLYRQPEQQVVSLTPLPAGSLVDIQKSEQQGLWIKVHTSDGRFGFLRTSAVRLVE